MHPIWRDERGENIGEAPDRPIKTFVVVKDCTRAILLIQYSAAFEVVTCVLHQYDDFGGSASERQQHTKGGNGRKTLHV